MSDAVYKVAINAPLHGLFDYVAPVDGPLPAVGCRVQVSFGPRRVVGMVVEIAASSDHPRHRLKAIRRTLDDAPLFDEADLALLRWASDYYRHPLGEVIAAALPRPLRDGAGAHEERLIVQLSTAGRELDPATLNRAPRQRELHAMLMQQPDGVAWTRLVQLHAPLAEAARRMQARGWLEKHAQATTATAAFGGAAVRAGPTLTAYQEAAVDALCAAAGFAPFLLFGVTGSGKTEVYLRAIEHCLSRDLQSLVLVPEIALTPQLVERFVRRFDAPIEVLHSGLAGQARLAAWRAARDGRAGIVIGTRSAVLTPLARPGLIVVDEEHDASFKQQEGFRYSGRDMALMRARRADIPIVLGSATPALETLHNAATGRYRRLDLPERPGSAEPPRVHLIDIRNEPVSDGLTTALNLRMMRHLDQGGQIMLFLNRRGFAPAWFCSGCGWMADCRRCDAHLTYHQRDHRLRCHHCGADNAVPATCPECEADLKPVGQGTERIEEVLRQQFPDARIDRLDRDSTRRRGALEGVLTRMRTHETDILVGTQMVTKGHHFPNVSLVGIINADQGLFSTDFRATERLAQMIVQVCGRAGRAERAGEVLIQTSFPEHPLLQTLIREGYEAFADSALAERQEAGWPPFAHLALLRARGADAQAPLRLLRAVADAAVAAGGPLRVLGPAQAPMARRAGHYHAQLLLQARQRGALNAALVRLAPLLADSQRQYRVRCSVDVDPIDLF